MEHKSISSYSLANRTGWHYFPDSLHYREKDLATWLPNLKELGAGWLMLNSPIQRAIPEDFISTLVAQKIRPIIDFNLPLSQETPWNDLEVLLRSYGKWGVSCAILNQQPNSQAAWGMDFWKQPHLVNAHCEQFMRFAQLALDYGIKPVFSPLLPGGDYWDLAFLEDSLRVFVEQADDQIINQMMLSSFAWHMGRSLNWGAGGQTVWQEVKPYRMPKNSQDQCGFRAFEWYQQKAETILGKRLPSILLEAGIRARPGQASIPGDVTDIEKIQSIQRLLNGENVFDVQETDYLIHAIPPEVQACFYYLLSAENSPEQACAWFTPSGRALVPGQAFLQAHSTTEKTSIVPEPGKTQEMQINTIFEIGRFILIDESLRTQMPEILEGLHAYIEKHKAMVGFSLDQAKQAAHVLIISEQATNMEPALDALQENGNLARMLCMQELPNFIQEQTLR